MDSSLEKLVKFSISAVAKDKYGNIMPDKISLVVLLFKITARRSRGTPLVYKKGIYPYEYMNTWERLKR